MFLFTLPFSSTMRENVSISFCRKFLYFCDNFLSFAISNACMIKATESGLYWFGKENGIPSLLMVVFIPVSTYFASA